jgi:hypothetical protein
MKHLKTFEDYIGSKQVQNIKNAAEDEAKKDGSIIVGDEDTVDKSRHYDDENDGADSQNRSVIR